MRERVQHCDIGQDKAWLMESADKVLAMRRVDTGLASDRAINLCQKAGRYLYETNSAPQNCRCEPGQVPDHPAAQGDHDIPPFDLFG